MARLLRGCSQFGVRPQTDWLLQRAVQFIAWATVTLVIRVATGAFRNRNNSRTLAKAGNSHTREKEKNKFRELTPVAFNK